MGVVGIQGKDGTCSHLVGRKAAREGRRNIQARWAGPGVLGSQEEADVTRLSPVSRQTVR
jgi:hypothetical protein